MSTRSGTIESSETTFPPRTVHDETGAVVGVILAVGDYTRFLHVLAERADWEDLPAYLQDAVDNLLADEAEPEPGESCRLRDILQAAGELP
jgi:hypothetical protein